MSRLWVGFGMLAALLVIVLFSWGRGSSGSTGAEVVTSGAPADRSSGGCATGARRDALYGRVTTLLQGTFEGRLRWGGDEEAFWDDYFNGTRAESPWVGYVPLEQRSERRPLELFGIRLGETKRVREQRRPFMARFGDLIRIELDGRRILVTLKSGSVVELDRFGGDDLADGIRVWDPERGTVDLGEWQIRVVEFLPPSRLEGSPERLHGTVRSSQGEFTGFVQWDRAKGTAADQLVGRTRGGEVRLRFDSIRAIARTVDGDARVTLRDGRELDLAGTRDVGAGNRGLFVEDRRFGRILVSWEAFEQIDFSASGGGLGYEDFAPGRPLYGTVTTRRHDLLIGRVVYDLDESESIETLDAPAGGVSYSIPFGRIARVVKGGSTHRVGLHGGTEVDLDPAGDLGESNAGVLVFTEGDAAQYVPWSNVARIDFERH